MDMLLDYYDNPPDYAPWWGKKQREKNGQPAEGACHKPTRIYRAERTAFGPQAFTYFTKKAGVFDQALGVDALYPVPFQLNDVFYDPHSRPGRLVHAEHSVGASLHQRHQTILGK
jgi:hypothetical protein